MILFEVLLIFLHFFFFDIHKLKKRSLKRIMLTNKVEDMEEIGGASQIQTSSQSNADFGLVSCV